VCNNICREEDECEDRKLKLDDKSSRNQFSNGDTDESTKSYFSEVSISFIKAKNSCDFLRCIVFCTFLNFSEIFVCIY